MIRLQTLASSALQESCASVFSDFSETVSVVRPNLETHGHLAASIALSFGKRMKRSPMEVASEIVSAFAKTRFYKEWVERTEIVAPGFINIFFKHDALLNQLSDFIGSLSEVVEPTEKIVIEHTNVNPNKAMHIGHLRNALYGDCLRRVLNRTGFSTEVQYYVDDTGVQVADSFLAHELFEKGELQTHIDPAVVQHIEALIKAHQSDPKSVLFDEICWFLYAAINQAYEAHPELLDERKKILHAIEDRTSEIAGRVRDFSRRILGDHLRTMGAFEVSYDLLVWESDILGFGFWDQAFSLLQHSDAFQKETEGKNAGCWVLKSGKEGDEEHSPDKIVVKSDGTVTYTGKDIAYHLWKYNLLGRDFLYKPWEETQLVSTDPEGTANDSFGRANRVYNVIDVRQSYPQEMVKWSLERLGYAQQAEQLRHVSYGVVGLSKNALEASGLSSTEEKRAYSMSGRKGIGVRVSKVLEAAVNAVRNQTYAVVRDQGTSTKATDQEIAIGAIKYFMLRYNPHTDIVFDFSEALALEGATGPYAMYAHARAQAILKNADDAGGSVSAEGLSEGELRLVLQLYAWPTVVHDVADDLAVNQIATYAFELANAFNAFYESNPVLKADEPVRARRVRLVSATAAVLADALGLLGITAPDTM